MKYLKIFNKYFIFIYIFFIAGCVSELRTFQTDEYIEPESNKVLEPALSSIIKVEEIDIPVYSVDWTNPIAEIDSISIILPEIPLDYKKSTDTERLGYQNVSSFLDNYYLGTGYVYDITKILEQAAPVEPTYKEQVTEKTPLSTSIVLEEEELKTEISERYISAPILDKLDISLPGMGWIYLPEKNNESVEYIGRKFTNENTIYVFIPSKEGHFILNFQFQDLTSDFYILEKINLEILKNKSNLLTDIITGDADIIVEVDTFEITEKVSLEILVNKMLQEDDCKGLAELLPEILDSTNPAILSLYPEVAQCLYDSTLYLEAIQILEKFVKDERTLLSMDYQIYLLGKLYETDSDSRNELISASYYKRLIDNFPASIYWDESQDRYRYLKRRYIDIR